MGILQQAFLLPFAFVWVPGSIILVIVSGAYALTQQIPQVAESVDASVGVTPELFG